ncbi:MAG: peptidoglycan editing factor PgeF [Muribaculaceae bacterium]|nr:peptidoglycan editing factor PgeF [Muribaculaceae bacterium]
MIEYKYYIVKSLTVDSTSALIFNCPGVGTKKYPRDFYDRMATTPVQTHSINVREVDNVWQNDFDDTDALVTFKANVSVGVRTADCVPVLMSAPDVCGVAAVHAGWKGTLGGIIDRTLDMLEAEGADLSKLKVAFGPSICPDCYEVDRDLADKFIEAGFGEFVSWPDGDSGKPHLDLQGINIERLRRRGVPKENIEPSEECTCHTKDAEGNYVYPSYRRDKTTDRILSAIMLMR